MVHSTPSNPKPAQWAPGGARFCTGCSCGAAAQLPTGPAGRRGGGSLWSHPGAGPGAVVG